jgi:homoserine O-acetyltransferase
LLTEGLKIKHVRMILGNSMGGMHVWIWGIQHPDFMDVMVPMASMPSEMSGRNWMMRRLITDSIRNDPQWLGGNYTTQPRSAQVASVFYAMGTNGGNQALQRLAPTREKADQLLDQRLNAQFTADLLDSPSFPTKGYYLHVAGAQGVTGTSQYNSYRRRHHYLAHQPAKRPRWLLAFQWQCQ